MAAETMENRLRVLITAIPAKGHINAVTGFGDLLVKKGHTVIFSQRESFRNVAESHHFVFEPFNEDFFPPGPEVYNDWFKKSVHLFQLDGVERWKAFTEEDQEQYGSVAEEYPKVDRALTEVINRVENIDVVVGDFVVPFPFSRKLDIMYLPFVSINPLSIFPKGIPPYAGFSTKETNKDLMEDYRSAFLKGWSKFTESLKEWYLEAGCQELAESWNPLNSMVDRPKYFGFYHYPDDIDYHEFDPPFPNFVRLDSCAREADSEKFQVPESLVDKPGRLIFFSMGSLASIDLALMTKLLKILAKSPNRFIVSTGADGESLKLYENMWGEQYVNQIQVLQVVDLVITHGGNNTLMETLYYGRPMIVIPYFFDQLDNAQRVEEKGLGRRINFWDMDDQALLGAIEEVLADQTIKDNVQRVSNNMRSSKSGDQAVKMLEEAVMKRRQDRYA